MANEISVSVSLAASKGGATISANGSATITMSGDQMIGNVQNIGTSNEQITLGDVSTIGYVYVKNMDATNYVEVSLDTGQTQVIAKLLAGEICLFKPTTATLYAKANTAACNIYVAALEL